MSRMFGVARPGRSGRGRALVALLVAAALTATSGVVPTVASAQRGAATKCERQIVLDAWITGGMNVHPAAAEALLGGEPEICAFLEQLPGLVALDDREAAGRMKAGGGVNVAQAANAALRSDQEGAVTEFLRSGWQSARQMDLRGGVGEMKAVGGPQVRAAAQAALNNGSADVLGKFLDSGWRQPYRMDLRASVNAAMAKGGPEVQATANRALNDGSLEMLVRFVEIDWGVAQARDNEKQTLTDLRNVAAEATRRAALEATAAVAQARVARAEADAARLAAEEARNKAKQAGQNSAVAKQQARIAAGAADKAVAAAEVAVSAARAAGNAARAAAGAAGRAATAAARAHTKAGEAWSAATDAELAESDAAAAFAAATRLGAVGADMPGWRSGIDQIVAVNSAALDAVLAAGAARQATYAAGVAAEEAGALAGEASAEAKLAHAAATRAKASAERARRATEQAAHFADIAVGAARTARDAAERAITNAEQAAAAAISAGQHAGNAVNAAELASAHAQKAYQAASDALGAAELAQEVYTAARAADAERLQDELEAGLARARRAQDAADDVTYDMTVTLDSPMSDYHSDKTNTLIDQVIEQADDPNADQALLAKKAREVALQLVHVPGTWTSMAAVEALGADDETRVLEFVRTALPQAQEQDDRTTLSGLMVMGSDAMRRAAQQALDGTGAQVASFLREQVYPERVLEDRTEINRLLADARANGGTEVAGAAQAALNDGSATALRRFLETTYPTAQAMDVRGKVQRIAGDTTNGVEVRNGAQIALAGTTGMQIEFLEVGRHQAAQRDLATATHNFVALSLTVETSQIAQQAVELARLAQAAAADANNSANEAIGFRNQAVAAAEAARGFAAEAVAHAENAAGSAERAAAAVRTAAAAAARANTSARQAAGSAQWARASAVSAMESAASAYAAYEDAYVSQLVAGAHASEAARIAAEVFERHKEDAQNKLRSLQANWYGHCRRIPDSNGEVGTDEECRQYRDSILGGDKNPLYGPFAQENVRECHRLFAGQGRQYDTCLAAVLSPDFDRVVRGIHGRISDTEDAAYRARDLQFGELISILDAAKGVGECKTLLGALQCLIELPGSDQYGDFMDRWNSLKITYDPVQLPAELQFGGKDVWGLPATVYLSEHWSDQVITNAIDETQWARELLAILPIECTLEQETCVYDDLAATLRQMSDQYRPENNVGYLVDKSGVILDPSGLPITTPPPADDLEAWSHYAVESGLHDDVAELRQRLAMLYLQEFGVALSPPANHLETKLVNLVASREVALRDNTLRLVMNNSGGVCDALPADGQGPDAQRQLVAGCLQAIQLLLPEGTSMIVYYPNPADTSRLLQVKLRGFGRWRD
ncbi:hypothetical protein [Kribbella sp. ALI-6-A]|uniref:hypothetical protein n=1 Tax=Kribbella sp. ALI-6-A TaxID=1933817 RepID=UPI0009FCCF36|nr:hypothetical protein [Kribbella sp. ALI-6-A]